MTLDGFSDKITIAHKVQFLYPQGMGTVGKYVIGNDTTIHVAKYHSLEIFLKVWI